MDDLIPFYFHLGLNYEEIIGMLTVHDICISKRTLHRFLRRYRLYRRNQKSSLLDVALFVENQLNQSGQLLGYRTMHNRAVQEGLVVSRDDVRRILLELDPQGVALRSRRRLRRRVYFSKGPNYTWHLDSYDKLKPYGLCISGCIDGFSRLILWLEVYRTSSDPRIIAGYFIETVGTRSGHPVKVRGDLGNENGHVAQMQIFLGENSSFVYGKSTANQRIEAWWAILRRQCTEFWISLFQQMKIDGVFSGDQLDKWLVQFCFTNVLQIELDSVAQHWNSHVITKPRNSTVVTGRPILLYSLPEIYGTHDYILPVSNQAFDACRDECTFRDGYPCDKDLFDVCTDYMAELGWTAPTDAYEAVDLYSELRNRLQRDLR